METNKEVENKKAMENSAEADVLNTGKSSKEESNHIEKKNNDLVSLSDNEEIKKGKETEVKLSEQVTSRATNNSNDADRDRHKAQYSLARKKPEGGRFQQRRRVLDTRTVVVDYKKPTTLSRFISKTGKIYPRRMTGATALIQRRIAREIKYARHVGLLPYTNR